MEKIKVLFSGKSWLIPAAAAVILSGSALQVFVKLHTAVKIVLAIIVFLAFIVLGVSLLMREARIPDKSDNISINRLKARRKAAKSTEDIMTITYAAVVVLGTFCGSLLVIGTGIVLFVMHTLISVMSNRYYLKRYKG
ncbi:MAG: hypothetical protein Q4C14_06675 [Bacillota bacterium]|nr:hypothetical protein [Bacillota bacterium]